MSDVFTKKEKIILALVLAILAFSFYWLSYKPHQAAKTCANDAIKASQSQGITIENYYEHCMLRKGYR
ncbi:MAG TPA: hypothetical protein VJ926_02735 [Patescibacteria group bacterium]|nr:hypothetical protein [Patescibacteria group bacterium]